MKPLTFILTGILLSASAAFAGDAINPSNIAELAAQKCMGCHTGPHSPNLGAQDPAYLFSATKAYRDGDRWARLERLVMGRKTKGLDDATIQALVDYIATTPNSGVITEATDEMLARGKEVYMNGIPAKNVMSCNSCHGDQGEGYPGVAPRLAGQMQMFQVIQLRDYKKGTINNQKDMSDIAKQMTDSDIQAVSAYMTSLSTAPITSR